MKKQRAANYNYIKITYIIDMLRSMLLITQRMKIINMRPAHYNSIDHIDYCEHASVFAATEEKEPFTRVPARVGMSGITPVMVVKLF